MHTWDTGQKRLSPNDPHKKKNKKQQKVILNILVNIQLRDALRLQYGEMSPPQQEVTKKHSPEQHQRLETELFALQVKLTDTLQKNIALERRLENAITESVRLAGDSRELKRKHDKTNFNRSAMDTLRMENKRLTEKNDALEKEVLRRDNLGVEASDFGFKGLESHVNEGDTARKAVLTVISSGSLRQDQFYSTLDKSSRMVYFPKDDSFVSAGIMSITDLVQNGRFNVLSNKEIPHDTLASVFGNIYLLEHVKVIGGGMNLISHDEKDMLHPNHVAAMLGACKKSWEEKIESIHSELQRLRDEVERTKSDHAAERTAWQKEKENLKAQMDGKAVDVKKRMAAKNMEGMKKFMNAMQKEMDVALEQKDEEMRDIILNHRRCHHNETSGKLGRLVRGGNHTDDVQIIPNKILARPKVGTPASCSKCDDKPVQSLEKKAADVLPQSSPKLRKGSVPSKIKVDSATTPKRNLKQGSKGIFKTKHQNGALNRDGKHQPPIDRANLYAALRSAQKITSPPTKFVTIPPR